MQPSPRKTRSHTSPGVVDLPKSRRSPTDVAADKAESKKIALANAKKMRERAAQVARVENEIRTAQKEAAYPPGGSQKRRVKKTFSRQDIVEDSEVSLFNFFLIALTHHIPKAADTENAPTASQGSSSGLKRKAGETSGSFDDDEVTRPTKIAKYAAPHFLVFRKLTALGY
jgi:hypothetical protein